MLGLFKNSKTAGLGFNLDAVLSSNEREWVRFYRFALPIIERAANRVLHRQGIDDNAAAFQDCVAATFDRLTRNDFAILHKWDSSRGSIQAFLAVVAGSTASNHLRDTRQKNTVSMHESEATEAAVEAIAAEQNHDLREGGDIGAVLAEAGLSEQEQRVAKMIFAHDLETNEVAQALGISPATVRVLKGKALKKLRGLDANDLIERLGS